MSPNSAESRVSSSVRNRYSQERKTNAEPEDGNLTTPIEFSWEINFVSTIQYLKFFHQFSTFKMRIFHITQDFMLPFKENKYINNLEPLFPCGNRRWEHPPLQRAPWSLLHCRILLSCVTGWRGNLSWHS